MSSFNFNRLLTAKVFSLIHSSKRLTRNLSPLICLYLLKRRSEGSVCSLEIRTNAQLSSGKKNKPTFYREIANWIEIWSTCKYFTLTKQTSHALVMVNFWLM